MATCNFLQDAEWIDMVEKPHELGWINIMNRDLFLIAFLEWTIKQVIEVRRAVHQHLKSNHSKNRKLNNYLFDNIDSDARDQEYAIRNSMLLGEKA